MFVDLKEDLTISQVSRFDSILLPVFTLGTPELEDISYAKDAHAHSGEVVNKFSFKTTTTGSLVLRMNTAFQSKYEILPSQCFLLLK